MSLSKELATITFHIFDGSQLWAVVDTPNYRSTQTIEWAEGAMGAGLEKALRQAMSNTGRSWIGLFETDQMRQEDAVATPPIVITGISGASTG